MMIKTSDQDNDSVYQKGKRKKNKMQVCIMYIYGNAIKDIPMPSPFSIRSFGMGISKKVSDAHRLKNTLAISSLGRSRVME